MIYILHFSLILKKHCLNIWGKNKTKNKSPFSLWFYYEKLNKFNLIDREFLTKDYITYTNNVIPINKKVSVKLFIEVIKNLLTINYLKRMKGERIKEKKSL